MGFWNADSPQIEEEDRMDRQEAWIRAYCEAYAAPKPSLDVNDVAHKLASAQAVLAAELCLKTFDRRFPRSTNNEILAENESICSVCGAVFLLKDLWLRPDKTLICEPCFRRE